MLSMDFAMGSASDSTGCHNPTNHVKIAARLKSDQISLRTWSMNR